MRLLTTLTSPSSAALEPPQVVMDKSSLCLNHVADWLWRSAACGAVACLCP